ncbi:MAG TPA: MIT C-terminal domain-containing protein [Saprospiraceae bacterium]|nr:MIT C-terminal domain-containing protein [Saprospiraceae bacterium]
MNRLPTYCELEFLDYFFELKKSIGEEEDEYIEKWSLLNKVIHSRCILYIVKYYEFEKRKEVNPFYKKLYKNSNTGGSEIREYDNKPNEPIKSPLALILGNGSLRGQEYHISCDSKTWANIIPALTYTNCCSVDDNITNFNGWNNFYNEVNSPITGIIIADPYILKNNQAINNLRFILEAILSKVNSVKELDISIFVHKDQVPNFGGSYNSILKYINELNLGFSTNFSIHAILKDKFHDRDIITNYTWAHSGHSLDYYNKNNQIIRKTTIDLKSIACIDKNPHIKLIREFANIAKNGKKNFDMLGNGKNNLYNI